jgi:hypothetical protein
MQSAEYQRSLDFLRVARDSELFTYDIRAKSQLVEYIRKLNQQNVHVLDLEKYLEEKHFGFGAEDFVDYFHFNDRSHRMIAEGIYSFMKQHHI